MTTRQLLLDTLSGKKTDRIPVAPFIYNNLVSELCGAAETDLIRGCVGLYKKFGFDILLRNYIMADYLDETFSSCAQWQVSREEVKLDAHNWDEITYIQTPQRRLSQRKSFRCISPHETVEAITEYWIKSPEDFEQFPKYQPPYPQFDCSKLRHARTLVGDDGLSGTWIHGAFNMSGMHRKLDDLLADPYEDDAFFAKMMDYFTTRIINLIPQLVDAGSDFLVLAGNMASGSMVGPKLFASHIMPYENRIIDAIHQAGAKCIYHNCGDAKSLLPLYATMEMDLYESLTQPPYGDTLLDEALSTFPATKALSGNVDQIHFLRTADPKAVRAAVQQILARVTERGCFVLAASDYIAEGTPPENLFAFAAAARQFGAAPV